MEIVLKFLLSGTLILTINFVIKTFTSSSFDKLFIPKHQKVLQTACIFVIAFIIFFGYGMLFGSLYMQIKQYYSKFIDMIFLLLFLIYITGLACIIVLCIVKVWKEKRSGVSFNISMKKISPIILTLLFLNMIIYAIMLSELILTTGLDKYDHIMSILRCTIVFFVFAYGFLKAQVYLQGFKDRWVYVLSPIPKDVDKRYFTVLYSLSPTQLVLSEDNVDHKHPSNIYLYDITKQTYTHFERVLMMNKGRNS